MWYNLRNQAGVEWLHCEDGVFCVHQHNIRGKLADCLHFRELQPLCISDTIRSTDHWLHYLHHNKCTWLYMDLGSYSSTSNQLWDQLTIVVMSRWTSAHYHLQIFVNVIYPIVCNNKWPLVALLSIGPNATAESNHNRYHFIIYKFSCS